MFVVRRRSRPGREWRIGSYGYTGGSAAHLAIEHILAAEMDLVSMLIGGQISRTKASCLGHLDEARRQLRKADLDDLGLSARWIAALRSDHVDQVIDLWLLTHAGHPLQSTMEQVFKVMTDIELGLFAPDDHWLRLYADGLISDAELRLYLEREPHQPHATRRDLARQIKVFRDAVAAMTDG